MSNYLNIPFVLPFKFLPNTATPGIHFDDDWACEQIRFGQMNRFYAQKWKRAVTTKLQVTSTIPPDDLKLYDVNKAVVKSFAWTVTGIGVGNERVYECTYDVSTGVATDGYYWLYLKAELLSVKFEAISEPIYIKNDHRNVREFVYKHSMNDFGVIWTTGITMTFMCEADIREYDFEHDRNEMVDQVHNISDLSAFPFRSAKLLIGEAPGVAPYIVDIANRVMCCDHVLFKSLLIKYAEGSKKWDTNRAANYPLIGASIAIMPAKNNSSLQFNDEDPIAPGIVTAYSIDQGFFGTANIVHITDFEMI